MLVKSFDLQKCVTLVPSFDELDADAYFSNFERTANHFNWPKSEWSWLLQSKLSGKAALTFNNLNDVSDYDFVKKIYS